MLGCSVSCICLIKQFFEDINKSLKLSAESIRKFKFYAIILWRISKKIIFKFKYWLWLLLRHFAFIGNINWFVCKYFTYQHRYNTVVEYKIDHTRQKSSPCLMGSNYGVWTEFHIYSEGCLVAQVFAYFPKSTRRQTGTYATKRLWSMQALHIL